MEKIDKPITGGCLCKAVRYEITAMPITTRICWCRLCQYMATGNATINVTFPSDAIKITGETRDFPSVADSDNQMHRRFCSLCGTHLFSSAETRPHLMIVRAGTLDHTEIAKPETTIWTSEAPSWACISDSIPRTEGQPPPPDARKA